MVWDVHNRPTTLNPRSGRLPQSRSSPLHAHNSTLPNLPAAPSTLACCNNIPHALCRSAVTPTPFARLLFAPSTPYAHTAASHPPPALQPLCDSASLQTQVRSAPDPLLRFICRGCAHTPAPPPLTLLRLLGVRVLQPAVGVGHPHAVQHIHHGFVATNLCAG